MTNILHIVQAKALSALTNQYELTDALDDMASLAGLLQGTSMFGGSLDVTLLQQLPALMSKLPEWMESLGQMQWMKR